MFPGTWSDTDCFHVLKRVFRQPVDYIWHKESDLSRYDCIILPGGFSYGDYLRAGAIASFSPVMEAVEEFAQQGKLVLGICNGFQILCEAGLLPGALMRNTHLEFRCQWVHMRVERASTHFTNAAAPGQVLRIPVSHGEGNYHAGATTIADLETRGGVVFRYCTSAGEVTEGANPNGSLGNIAGITNAQGNVLGLMPHPERCCEEALGGTDGRVIFESLIGAAVATAAARTRSPSA